MEELQLYAINLFQCEPGFQTGKRVLPSQYLLYVHRGTGRFKIGSEVHEAKAGDCFYCPPGVGNSIYAEQEDPFLLSGIEFYAGSGSGQMSGIAEKTNLFAQSFLRDMILEMVEEYQYGKTNSMELCNHLLAVLVERIRRDFQNRSSKSSSVARQLLFSLSFSPSLF